MTTKKTFKRFNRRGQRGFSLIELGIVVAVIAILATVVLVGRGFLESSRVSKMVEVIDTICKGVAVYAGSNGGQIPGANGANLLTELENRELVSNTITNSVPNFSVNSVTRTANPEQFTVVIGCASAQGQTSCKDIENAKLRDDSLTAHSVTATTVSLTFRL